MTLCIGGQVEIILFGESSKVYELSYRDMYIPYES